MLMEIIDVMKLTLGDNFNYKEARRGVSFVGRLYFFDQEKDELVILVDKISLLTVNYK